MRRLKFSLIFILLLPFALNANSFDASNNKIDTFQVVENGADTILLSPIQESVKLDRKRSSEEKLTKDQINKIRSERGLAQIAEEFVPKGQWIFGGAFSYSTHNNNEYDILIIQDVNSYGYTLKFTPLIAYSLSPNMAIGGRFVYGRTLLKIDDAKLSFGDEDDGGINITVDDYYILKQSYASMAIWRQYIPLGKNKRFALFNEVQLQLGGSESKSSFDDPTKGTYATSFDASIGISPGIVAFATNNVAFEVNVGVMGVSYSQTKQIHNQIYEGNSSSSFLNFKINLLSIGLGVAFYL